LISTVSDVPWEVVAYGRRIAPTVRGLDLLAEQLDATKILFRGEGRNSSVLISERSGQRQFYVSGKSEASTAPGDMRLERMMGDVPALVHAKPSSVLVVGFGAGITAGSLVPYPEVGKIVICELEPLIPPASTEFFRPQNYDVMLDPRTTIVYDDARHYILTTAEKFDVITTDPIHPWVKGTSTLYSKEYYDLVKRHLNPGGVVAQWLPIYDSDRDTVKTELATFFAAFPGGTVWSNFQNNDGYDLVLLGQPDGTTINVDQLQARLDRPDYARVVQSLGDVGFHSAVEILATYAGRASDMKAWLAGVQINSDLNLRLQFLAGLGLNSMSFPKIYREMLTYRRFPEGLLVGNGARINVLHALLPNPQTISK
jgi:spermidine synthase